MVNIIFHSMLNKITIVIYLHLLLTIIKYYAIIHMIQLNLFIQYRSFMLTDLSHLHVQFISLLRVRWMFHLSNSHNYLQMIMNIVLTFNVMFG